MPHMLPCALAGAMLALVSIAPAFAQGTGPIRLVVPFAAGGPTDIAGRVMALQEVRERLAVLGMQPVTSTPVELAAHLKFDIAKWSKVARDGGIKLE